MKEELGRDWLEPDLFRIGASSLLADIERQLEHFVTGRYSRRPSATRWPEDARAACRNRHRKSMENA